MKKTIRLIGIIALAAVIGFTFAACDDGSGNGTTQKSLVSIAVTTQPTKVQYNLGEAFDPAGMVVTATYDDASTAAVTGYTVNGFDSATAGNKSVTVSYGGKTSAPFTVSVIDPADPQPPSAAIAGSVTVTATKANASGNGAEDADATVTVNLTNATVNAALSADASTWFTPSVAGLNYTASAAAGATAITITIEGIPTATSAANATISIPAGTVKDTEGTATTAPLTVSGNITYNIGEADPNALPTPAAAIDGSVTVTATKANFSNEGGEAANATVTLNLTNATVNTALSAANASAWFTPTVAGLTYTANAAAGATAITVTIAGTPTGVSTANATISIPAGTVKNTEGTATTAHLTVSGHITYDIEAYPDPEITGFLFSAGGGRKIGEASTAAGAHITNFLDVVGGTGDEFTFSLVSGEGSTDNALFVIDNPAGGGYSSLKVGSSALTAAKQYSVRVQVSDAAGKTFAKVCTFNVAAADLTGFTFLPNSGLLTGTHPLDIGEFSDPVGGTAPYTYSLVDGEGSTDNSLFNIGNVILYAKSGLTVAKQYSVRVQVADGSSPQQTFAKAVTFTVSYPPVLTPSAAISGNESIGGIVAASDGTGGSAANTTIWIYLTNASVKSALSSTNVSAWFSQTVAGLTYTANASAGASTITIAIAGTPTATSTATTTITIPASQLNNSNGETMTNNLAVTGGTITYSITKAPEYVVEVTASDGYPFTVGDKYYSIQEAVSAQSANGNTFTLTVLTDIELDATVNMTAYRSMYLTIKAGSGTKTIRRAEGFTGNLFNVTQGNLFLGNGVINGATVSSIGAHTPTLIIDGNNQSGTLVDLQYSGSYYAALLIMTNGVELRNAAGVAVSLYGSSTTRAAFNMRGGVIAGNNTGVYIGSNSSFVKGQTSDQVEGIVYGSDGGANKNNYSVDIGYGVTGSNATFTLQGVDQTLTAGTNRTDTFGTAP